MQPEALAGRPGKQEDCSAPTREAKLGNVFTQTITGPDGDPVHDPASTTNTGTFQGCCEAGILLLQEALRRGLDRAQTVVCLGDGAPWIWENCRLNFPGALQILDFYHATGHVGSLAGALHDTDPTLAKTW